MNRQIIIILVLILIPGLLVGTEELKLSNCWNFNITTRVKTTNVEVSRIVGPLLLTVRVVNKEGVVIGEDVPLWQEFGVMGGFIINTRFLALSVAGGYGVNLISKQFYGNYAGELNCYVYLLKSVGLGIQVLYLPQMSKEGVEILAGLSFRIK